MSSRVVMNFQQSCVIKIFLSPIRSAAQIEGKASARQVSPRSVCCFIICVNLRHLRIRYLSMSCLHERLFGISSFRDGRGRRLFLQSAEEFLTEVDEPGFPSSLLRRLFWTGHVENLDQPPRLGGHEKHAVAEIHGFLHGMGDEENRSEERRVGKECRSRWSP